MHVSWDFFIIFLFSNYVTNYFKFKVRSQVLVILQVRLEVKRKRKSLRKSYLMYKRNVPAVSLYKKETEICSFKYEKMQKNNANHDKQKLNGDDKVGIIKGGKTGQQNRRDYKTRFIAFKDVDILSTSDHGSHVHLQEITFIYPSPQTTPIAFFS